MSTYITRSIAPDFGAIAETEGGRIAGALLTVGLITGVAMVIVCAVGWALAAGSGNWQAMAKARGGVLVALGGAVCCGGVLAWTTWLIDTGSKF
jgi:hypothetical protein